MLVRRLLLAVVVALAACGPTTSETPTAGPAERRAISLYPEAAEARLFADAYGFEIPPDAPLDELFGRASGALLSQAGKTLIGAAVSVGPESQWVTTCAPIWRHVFVFYDDGGRALGALAYCRECGMIALIGSIEDQLPDQPHDLSFDGAGLVRVIEAHNMMVEEKYRL